MKTTGIVRFGVPDDSLPVEKRAFYMGAPYGEVKDASLPLHDVRTDDAIVPGAAGLDAQGFTFLRHHSQLAEHTLWLEDDYIEKVYIPECEEVVRKLTGATRTVANHVFFRRKLVDQFQDYRHVLLKDDPEAKLLVEKLESMPKDQNLVFGREDASHSLPPVVFTHADYSNKGLRATVRYARREIAEAGKDFLLAEDAGTGAEPRRCASYSVWRPLSPVKRDPIALCDWRTLDPSLLQPVEYRAPSEVSDSGEYINEMLVVLPPKDEGPQPKWYWMPDQGMDDLLIIKFADTASERSGSDIAAHCVHARAVLADTERLPPRESVEVRIVAFW